MIHLLYMDIRMLAEEALYAKALTLISEKRKEKILRFQNPLPARLSLGAGVLLTMALDRYHLKERIEEIRLGKYGKPYLPDAAFHFSLSHSDHYAVCAFGDLPLGADIQWIKEQVPLRTSRILSKEEQIYLEKFLDQERVQQFYQLWARKESLMKWDGRGLRLPMQEISFIKEGILTDQIVFERKQLYFQGNNHWIPQYAISICSEKPIFLQKIEEITLETLIKY